MESNGFESKDFLDREVSYMFQQVWYLTYLTTHTKHTHTDTLTERERKRETWCVWYVCLLTSIFSWGKEGEARPVGLSTGLAATPPPTLCRRGRGLKTKRKGWTRNKEKCVNWKDWRRRRSREQSSNKRKVHYTYVSMYVCIAGFHLENWSSAIEN